MGRWRIRLGGPDNVSIRAVKAFPRGLFVSPLVDNGDQRLQEFLIRINFENGAAIFGGVGDLDVLEFRRLTSDALEAISDQDVFNIIQYFRQRGRNFGHIQNLHEAQFNKATVCADHNCCPINNGNRISVADAISKVEWLRTMSHEQYGRQFYGRDWGIPPFNVKCLCRLTGVLEGRECWRVHKKMSRQKIFRKFWP